LFFEFYGVRGNGKSGKWAMGEYLESKFHERFVIVNAIESEAKVLPLVK
jgi:hypothetical protein